MIELLTADTPNGKKISIMLEEIGLKYKLNKINIFKDEQFKPEFKKISPFSKIPVIIDHEVNESIFVPLGAKHRLSNPGKTLLILIEVQSGDYLGEDDIVRFDDIYGRDLK